MWQKIGSQGNQWKRGSYFMDGANSINGYVVFEAVRGSGVFGDIALDDITVTPGPCPTSYGKFPAVLDSLLYIFCKL